MRGQASQKSEALGPYVAALRGVVLAAAGAFVLLYLVLACVRVRYPFELEWLEGAAVDHVRTILSGDPLYARPSLRFTPLTYTPGYFYLSAWLSRVTGEGFLPLRLISIGSSLGVLALIYRLAAREADRDAGVVAAGLFAATYGWTDGWFDLARNDSLMLLLALSAIALLRRRRSTAAAVAAGVLISLCFLVKQTGLVMAIPLAVCCLTRGWRPSAGFAATVVVLTIGTSLLLDRAFAGWYWYYVFDVPAQHPLATGMVWGFWRFDLLRPMPLALAAAMALVAASLRRRPDTGLFYLLCGGALIGGAFASRLHSLSYVNVVLPAYAALAIGAAIALSHAVESIRRDLSGRRRILALASCYALALLQLGRLAYNPSGLVPRAADVAAGRQFIARLERMPGTVLVPYHGYLPVLAGKPANAHAVVIADVIRGGTTDVERELQASLETALTSHAYDAVIAYEDFTPVRQWLRLDDAYQPADRVVAHRSRFWRPEVRYIPR